MNEEGILLAVIIVWILWFDLCGPLKCLLEIAVCSLVTLWIFGMRYNFCLNKMHV